MGEDMLKIDMEPIRGFLFIRLVGSLHKGNVSKLDKEVICLLRNARVKNIVLNIKNLDYVDYYGKKEIINGFQVCLINNGNVFICISDKQKRLFDFDKYKSLKIITDEPKAFN